MKIRKILVALLAVSLLTAFAACSEDAPPAQDEPSSVSDKITAAEVENNWHSLRFADKNVPTAAALYDLVKRRIYIWEADSLGLLPDIEEARQQVRQGYESIRESAADSDDEYNYGAEIAWGIMQDYMDYMELSEEEYLEKAVETWQSQAAADALHEQVLAELPPNADELAQEQALTAYDQSLAEKYQERLVEDDLRPLLDEVLENWGTYGDLGWS